MLDLVLRHARLVCPDGIIEGDLGVEDGIIARIGTVYGPARREIDLGGRAVLPGVIDPHVHFRTPGHRHAETWADASRAAVAGGVTSVIDMPNTDPPTTDLDQLAAKARLVAADARCHYGFYVGATPDNLGDLRRLEAGDASFCGIKIYMGASTGRLLVDDPRTLDAIFRHTRSLIAVHAEDNATLQRAGAPYDGATSARVHGRSRPVRAAAIAVNHALELSAATDHALHICHVSSAAELAMVRADAGLASGRVTIEACTHHLAFDERRTYTHGSFAKMNPPLRPAANREALWDGVCDHTVSLVATDHAPHLIEDKRQPYLRAPSGVPGVETSLRFVLHEGSRRGLSLRDIARVMSQAAADRFGLPTKGRVAVGLDADLVVVSNAPARPFERREVLSHCGWSPFEGELLAAPPAYVFVAGRLAARGGAIVDDTVRGCPLTFRRARRGPGP